MKYIYLFFFLIYSLSSICQTNEAIKLTYRITNYLDLIATGTSELYILNEEKKSINVLSKYSYKKSKYTLDDAIYTLPKSKDANFVYITDLRNNKLISKENTIDEFFFIKEPITIQKWELIDEFKTLNNVKLQKAITTFRGRNYIAWCDLNTPISQGPWKFNNLPGLAYEISDAH